MRVRFIVTDGFLPSRKHSEDAGFDLASAEETVIQPMRGRVIRLGIRSEIPVSYEGQVRSRSGLAAKYQVFVLNGIGTIDSKYRDEWGVILFNLGPEPFVVKRGDRIAQVVFHDLTACEVERVNEFEDPIGRGGGFGSTGV